MSELLVNILPISENPLSREEMVNQFLSAVQAMASSKHWNHKKMRFTLTWENNCFTFQGGRYHLSPHCIKFVSVPVDIFDTNTNHSNWLKRYDEFIILADAKEVAEDQTTRLEIAKYRSLMYRQKLHSEEVLLLLDVQNILTIPDGYSYENTMVGILSALAGKERKGFALLPTYASLWPQIVNLHLGQRQLMLKTKNGNVIGLPINLMGTFNAFPHSGIMELLWKFMTILLEKNHLEIKRISNHLIYNTFIMAPFNITDFFNRSKKTIRLAVIGETSSGKSYLLTDFLTSLSNLGFTGSDDMKHNCRYAGYYITDVTKRNRAINQTIQSVARIDSHYRGIYSNEEDRFNLEFIDIPGEVITRDKIEVFSSIIEALWKRNKDIFKVETWTKDAKVYKVLYYPSNNQTVSNVSTHSYSGGLEDDENTSDNIRQNTPFHQTIMTTDEVRSSLTNAGYTQEEEISFASGPDVIKNFYSFHPDTVINGIMEAWNILEPQRPRNFQNEKYDKIQNYRELFKNNFQLDFYYLFFCINATDIVICNKMAIPASVGQEEASNGLTSFHDMMQALECLKAKKDIFSEKNWYLALKGTDSYMNPIIFKQAFNATKNHNTIYSYFISLLTHFIQLDTNPELEDNPFMEEVQTEHTSIASIFDEKPEDFNSILSSENQVNKKVVINMQTLAKKDLKKFFKPSTEYTITSGLDLRQHINQCIGYFNTLTQFDPQEEGLYQILQIPPHVYFPATPITSDFTICGHKQGAANIFEGNAATAGNRICFGTFQLCLDILKQHEIETEKENARYGGLLSYLMGD